MVKEEKEHIEAKGFLNHNKYTDFIQAKYSDVSVAFLQNDFEMLKRAMRELIDNSYPYHSHKFQIQEQEIEYPEYYEYIVSQYYQVISLEQKQSLTPKEQNQLRQIKDFFAQESRRLRRIIIKDLSLSNIIPQAEKIHEQKLNPLLEND